MKYPALYKDQEIVILGLAKSGVAAARILHQFGAKVTVNDKKDRSLCPEAEELEALGIRVICGHHPDELIHSEVKLLIKNPGIPYHIPPIQKAMDYSIEIVTEVELAFKLHPNRLIGITGSNGKTTTTTLVGLMLKEDHIRSTVAGNIGTPLCEAAFKADQDEWIVAELSSFQLKGTTEFRTQIACLLNIYEAHLDYHGTLDDYVNSKLKLFANQTKQDIAIINIDILDPRVKALQEQIKANGVPFSTTQLLSYGVYIQFSSMNGENRKDIVYRDMEGKIHRIMDTKEVRIIGKHNLENALAAISIALNVGVSIDTIRKVLQQFAYVEHRLEFVREINGVRFYNDAKATNSTATTKSIKVFDKKIILIAGGLDRGTRYDDLLSVFQQNIKGLITLGETREKLSSVALKAGVPLVESLEVDHESNYEIMKRAVEKAVSFAQNGDIVLLSPACASWDMFRSFEEKGDMFKQIVHTLE